MTPGGDEDEGESGGQVLSADELDIAEREEVESLGDDRYVVGPNDQPTPSGGDGGGPAPDPSGGAGEDPVNPGDASEQSTSPDDDAPGDDGSSGVTGRDVKSWLADELTALDSAYAYHIAAKADGEVAHQQLATDDVGAAFDGLLVWYARQVAAGTPVDEALGVLLAESSVQVRYPTSRLVDYLEANDLDPEDSIADLVDTVVEDDGLAFPERE